MKFIALTDYESLMLQRYLRIGELDIVVIPNGINEVFKAGPRRQRDCTLRRIIYLGRFHPKKNIESTILAIQNLNLNFPIEFRLYGPENSYKRELEEKYASENIIFEGTVYGDEKRKALSDADIFILVSHSEGLPMAVLEAVASRVKVVISKNCNVLFIDQHNLGVTTGINPDDIQKSILKVMDQEVGSYGAFLDFYNWDRSAAKLLKYLTRQAIK